MAKIAVTEKKDEPNAGDIVANFIQHNKQVFVFSLIAIAGAIVLFIAGYIINAKVREQSLAQVESLYSEYTTLRNDGLDSEENEDRIQAHIKSLNEFGVKKPGYAGARAYAILGELHAERKEWAEAREAWTKSAGKAPKIYLAPISLLNAALAAEEEGSTGDALALYSRLSLYDKSFVGAPRACFSTGRIHEGLGDPDAALDAYQNIIEKWPASDWAKYSQSRIIAINTSKL